ncbi:MAG: hypothetical protein PF450_03010, partial [Bacteroidales bacterium]|nr:hypothetical protein [Bacteroidales bacterium]
SYELPNYHLVHAGFDFSKKDPFTNTSGMLWIRDFVPNTDLLNNKRIVHGHSPVYMNVIVDHIQNKNLIIPLDNGAVYAGKHKVFDTSQLGRLCAFDLDTQKLYSIKTRDKV